MKNTIFGLILGIVVCALGFHIWFLYKLNTVVNTDHQTLVQVVDFLNKQVQSPANSDAAKK